MENGRIPPINIHGLPRLNQRTGQIKELNNRDYRAIPYTHGQYTMAQVHSNHTMSAKLKLPQSNPGKPAQGYIRGPLTKPRQYNLINEYPHRKYPQCTAFGAKKNQTYLILRCGPGKKTLRYPTLPNGIPKRQPGLY